MKYKKSMEKKRTIPMALLVKWNKLRKRGDAEKLAEKLKVSKPTINKALIYGCVHNDRITEGINKYFAERAVAERKTTKKWLKEIEKVTAMAE